MNNISFIGYETAIKGGLKHEIDKYINGFSHVAFCGDSGYINIVKGGHVIFSYTIYGMKEKILQKAYDSDAIKALAKEVVKSYMHEIYSKYFKIVIE